MPTFSPAIAILIIYIIKGIFANNIHENIAAKV